MEPPELCCEGLKGGGCGWREHGPKLGHGWETGPGGPEGVIGTWVGLNVPSLRIRAWVHGCREGQPG